MASRSQHLWPRRIVFSTQPCAFCQAHWSRQFSYQFSSQETRSPHSSVHASKRPQWIRYHGTQSRKTPQQVRTEIDARNRAGFYALARTEGLMNVDPVIAEKIIAEFLTSRNKLSLDANVKTLAEKYELQLSDITDLATTTHRITDVNDKNSRLPPSLHKEIARQLLLGCCKAKEPTATLHILSAVYLSPSLSTARTIASHFTQAEIRACRQELEILATAENPEAMTLLGQLLEREGSRQRARDLYEKALKSTNAKFEPSPRPSTALPKIPPWNALGSLLLSMRNDVSLEQAKEAFKVGALEGDDPVSYYYLATLEPRWGGKWFQYMSKAAGAGHLDAMYNLGSFFMETTSTNNEKVDSSSRDAKLLARSLVWLKKWRRGGSQNLAREWFSVAAQGGHKPSMLQLADLFESMANKQQAIQYLESMLLSPPNGKPEEWPELVQEAKMRLLKHKRGLAM